MRIKVVTAPFILSVLLGFMMMWLMMANSAQAATLSLSPASQMVIVGQNFSVNILLDTQGEAVDAVDVYLLNLNPSLLEIQDADSTRAGVQVQPGSLMANTVANGVDVALGKISFSQATSGGQTYTGSDTLAIISFKALVAGIANVTFDFTLGSTLDTNVAANGNDVLTVVTNGQYTINAGGEQTPTPTPSPVSGGGGGGVQAPTPTPIPIPITSNRPRPSQYNIREGDTVASYGTNDPDIYIVNDVGFKRLFLNPVIFGFYGHLGGFKYVKTISSTTRDVFETSGLFRNCETNDPKVYGVEVTGEDTGTLHWVNITGEQAVKDDPEFFSRVFCINNNEFNWYTQNNQVFGTAYSSVLQIPKYKRAGR